jgi:Trk K+ transport system NAD-binding subunit
VVSKLLREVHLPGDSVIAAIVRHNQIILPSPTTKLEVQDCVIALTRPQDEHALRVELAGASKPPRDAAAPNGKEV